MKPDSRYMVTVINEETLCDGRLDFHAQETFELVAGSLIARNGDGCEYAPAAGPPAFRDSQYVFENCGPDVGAPLELRCEARVANPACPSVEAQLRLTHVPKGGELVSSQYEVKIDSADCGETGCYALIDVSVQRM